ncbi:hypothetical protein RJ639_003867 [Escallonia herrerae]|uniref:Uncharacterized protein n=1 Tax=Escallonia herrerae TaxID=1293975 RepID=A0AA89B285_9ASTE|nr:hypothetical protein RJ639_003867 [Escallonia herrerae]
MQQPVACHVVAMPYPGRGHINPMMNLCKLIASKRADVLFTFIVTEEWLGFLCHEPKPDNIHFATVPNVIPSEKGRGADFPGFYESTLTRLQAPVERLLDRLVAPPSVIVYDTYLAWVVGVGNRRNVPVASLWTQPATVFSVLYHYDLLVQNGDVQVNLSERGDEHVNYIPGLPSTRIKDLPTMVYGNGSEVMHRVQEAMSWVLKAQYLLFTSNYELEAQTIDALKAKLQIPIYSIGPAIPYFKLRDKFSPISHDNEPNYVEWLDSQPKASVLYISQGSFLSVSSAQLDEIVSGVIDSGVRYLWVTRGEAARFKRGGDDNRGFVVPWCDQLMVLCHPCIGGFWSHCGWNSTKEGLFAGVPMLTFPIFWDQVPNSKSIVEDWKTGWRVKGEEGVERLVTREEIAKLVRRFMDLENEEGKEMRRRAKNIKEICRRGVAEGGSSQTDIDGFIKDISQC